MFMARLNSHNAWAVTFNGTDDVVSQMASGYVKTAFSKRISN